MSTLSLIIRTQVLVFLLFLQALGFAAVQNCSFKTQTIAEGELKKVSLIIEPIAMKPEEAVTETDLNLMRKTVHSISKPSQDCFSSNPKLFVLALQVAGFVCLTDPYQEEIDFLLNLESKKMFKQLLLKLPKKIHQKCIENYIRTTREEERLGNG